MSDQGGQAQTPPIPGTTGPSREEAIQALAMHVFGGPPPGGGKFTMDPDEMKDAIKRLGQLLHNLQQDGQNARPMVQVKSPGSELDLMGKMFADRANESGQAYIDANLAAQRYVKEYIDKLTAVLNAHTEVEQSNAQQFNQINQPNPGQPGEKGKGL